MPESGAYQKATRYQISVGTKDSETRTQKFTTEFIEKIICNVCRGYRLDYSISPVRGGYFHGDGGFVSEDSFCVTLIGAEENDVYEIAKDICAFLHQETVIVSRDTVDFLVLHESL